MLKGDLSIFSLGEIFQSLAINNHTGTLKILCPNHEEKLVYFRRGEIKFLSDDSPSTRVPRIGEVLLRSRVVTAEQVEECLADQKARKEGLPVGQILLQKGYVSVEDLQTAYRLRTLEGLYDLFTLKAGTFEFHMDEVPHECEVAEKEGIVIALNTNSVIMEGLRQVDEWGVINRRIKTFDEIFVRLDIPSSDPHDLATILLDQVNGMRPVKDLFRSFPGNRFECCKLLCDLLDKGWIRALSFDEAKKLAADKSDDRQHAQAATYLQFATQLNPTHAPTSAELGDVLTASSQDAAAREAYLKAVRLYYEQENYQAVAELGEQLLPRITFEDADLEKIFFSFVRLQNFKKAATTGNQLVASHQKKGNYQAAAFILEAVSVLDPRDLNLKIQLATFLDRAGEKERATTHLEEVSAALEKEGKLRELVKVLRLLSTMLPKQQEVKQRIAVVEAHLEKIAKRKKYGVTIAGVTIISLLILAVVPLIYELKARENLNHAKRLEEICMFSMDFTRAKEAYNKLVNSYAFSTKVVEAQAALDRIAAIEKTFLSRSETEADLRRREQDAKLAAVRDELANRIREAEAAEQTGDLEKAHEIYKKVISEYPEIPVARSLLLPLRISSSPPGATLTVDGSPLGKTPYLYRYKPGTTIQLSLTRASCEPAGQSIELVDQKELRFVLRRRPLGEFTPVIAIQQPLIVCQGRIILPSRDGNVYGIDTDSRLVAWQRVVGRFGDRVSDLGAGEDEVYLGTVTGEVTALSPANGKSRWIAKTGSSVLAAPAVSSDRKWVGVGTTSGSAFLIANDTGTIVGKVTTENEIVARPVFSGDLLIVGSLDNHLYGISVSRKALVLDRELSGDIALDVVLDGDHVVVTCADGTVHRLRGATLEPVWARKLARNAVVPVVATPAGLHVGTSTGHVVTLDRQTGDVAWELTAGSSPIAGMLHAGSQLVVTLESGKVVSIDLKKRTISWEFQSSAAFLCPPIVLGGLIYLPGATGRIQFLEMME